MLYSLGCCFIKIWNSEPLKVAVSTDQRIHSWTKGHIRAVLTQLYNLLVGMLIVQDNWSIKFMYCNPVLPAHPYQP